MSSKFSPDMMDDSFDFLDEVAPTLELELPDLDVPELKFEEEDGTLDSSPVQPPCVWVRSVLTEKEVMALLEDRPGGGELLDMWFTAADNPKPFKTRPVNVTFEMLLELTYMGVEATLELPGGVSKSLRDPGVMEKFISGSE